jgi:predicted acylesterase/phospholipase RssA
MTPETISTASTAPFSSIALCLSGGGYRAATYALGTMDMLHQLGLLDNVKLMSTVSGGTFTGVSYATSLSQGKGYEEFYSDFNFFLENTNCVELALDRLYKTPSPSERDDPSLIRAAADVYDEKLFGRRDREHSLRFKSLIDEVGIGKRFLELIFNSTEFRTGNSFRLRSSHDPDVFAGNGNFKVAPGVAEEFRLADIVAASSCFPAAFEPLRFPDDFVWKTSLADVRNQLVQDINGFPSGYNVDNKCISLPLMDGGIYDNQGISNAVLAYNIYPHYDLFLITDTSARDNDMLKYPKPDTKDGWLSINMLFYGAVLVFLISLFATGALGVFLYKAWETGGLTWFHLVFQYILPIGLFVTLMGILAWAYRLFSKNKEVVVAGVKFQLWDVVKKLSLPDFINMAKARFTSLGTMSGDVFMKRIRQLQFNNIMQDDKTKDLVSFNLIYDLNPTKPDPIWITFPDLKPTAGMKDLSAKAEAVKTTLWFAKGSPDQEILIACGQVTTCYSLLKYICKLWDRKSKTDATLPRPDAAGSQYNDIYLKLIAKWNELKTKYP